MTSNLLLVVGDQPSGNFWMSSSNSAAKTTGDLRWPTAHPLHDLLLPRASAVGLAPLAASELLLASVGGGGQSLAGSAAGTAISHRVSRRADAQLEGKWKAYPTSDSLFFGIRPVLYHILKYEYLRSNAIRVCGDVRCNQFFVVERAGQQFCTSICSQKQPIAAHIGRGTPGRRSCLRSYYALEWVLTSSSRKRVSTQP
jgi:hypothetical protein